MICVPPSCVAPLWPFVEPFIRKAMARGGMGDYAKVANDVVRGPDLLWLATDGKTIDAAGITSISDGTLTIVACGGDLSRCGHMIEGFEQFARDEGCTKVRICGRPGWLRRLSGYRTKKVIIEKAL
jgi:hypothetical protein